MKEIFKDIPQFEGRYQVSNLGRVKSLKRHYQLNDIILKLGLSKNGYYLVSFNKNKKKYSYWVHQLVAMVFLNHKPNKFKLVVDHKDFNRLNNRVDNLKIITNRENTSKSHIDSSSKYVGVQWSKNNKKWRASITINKKCKHLGYFLNEYDAHLTYQKALKDVV